MSFNYNIKPTTKIFNDLRDTALLLWRQYNDDFGYASEKISRVKDVRNYRDSYWEIIGMFDSTNQKKLLFWVRYQRTKRLIYRAIHDFGIDDVDNEMIDLMIQRNEIPWVPT